MLYELTFGKVYICYMNLHLVGYIYVNWTNTLWCISMLYELKFEGKSILHELKFGTWTLFLAGIVG